MSCPSNSQNLYINPSISLDLLLISITKFGDILSWYFSIGNVDILGGDVDVFEQIVVHVLVVGVGVGRLDGVVFVQVESNHILEAELPALMETDEFFVDAKGTAAGGQAEDTGVSLGILPVDFIFDDVGNSEGPFCFRLEALRCDFFDEGEARELGQVGMGVFYGRVFVEF